MAQHLVMALADARPELGLVPGISHHNLFLTLLQIALLLLLARGLGQFAARFGLPSVLGELSAGVLLGPSILGQLAPVQFAWLFPPEALQRNLLDFVAFLGVMLLLILTGLEIDLPLIASKGRTAIKVSAGGIVVPFAFGVAAAAYLVPDNLLTDVPRTTFALFIGTALSISAIPVIAKVLIELKMIKRDIGQLTLAAGMIDDAIGWILLSVVAGLAQSGTLDVGVALRATLTVLGTVGLMLTLGRRICGALLRWVDVRMPGSQPKLTLLFVLAFGMAALTEFLGIEAVLGTFLVGIVFGTFKRFDHRLVEMIETVALSVFAPIFFARAGLSVDLAALFTPQVFGVGMLVLAVAIVGKFSGAYLGASWAGLGRYEALSLGAGMNARGALEIIIATIGLNLGVLSTELYTVIVMVAIVTSLMAPPILRATMARVAPTPAERQRLEREERLRRGFLSNVNRVLLPAGREANAEQAAALVARIFGDERVEVTVLQLLENGADNAEREEAARPSAGRRTPESQRALAKVEAPLAPMSQVELRRVLRDVSDPAAAVLEEAARGYDLIVLGTTESRSRRRSEEVLFSPFADAIVRQAPCPVLVLSLPDADSPRDDALPLRKVVLPTLGEQSNRQASEIAFAAARHPEAVLHAVHFLLTAESISAQMNLAVADDAQRVAQGVVDKEAESGRVEGVVVAPVVVPTNASIQEAIVAYAAEVAADLIVFRSDERAVTQRAFFSHPLDHILSHAPCPVAIISGT